MLLLAPPRRPSPLRRFLLPFGIAAVVGASAGAALAFWTGGAGQPHPGSGSASAASVNQGATPTVSSYSGANVPVSWSASTLSNGSAVGGYIVKRYDAGTNALQTTLSGCSGTVTATSCTEAGVPVGAWKYTVTPAVGTNWRGPESAKSTAVTIDTTAPTHAFSLSSPVGAYRTAGGTLYYKSNASGSFRLVDALADAGTGPASVTFPVMSTTGWTHAVETVSTPAGGPYTSNTYSWTANPSNPTGYSVSGADGAGNSSSSGVTFASDITSPSGGSVSYTNGMVYQASVPVTTVNGTDSQSGVDTSSTSVVRAQATLNTSTQVCGTFGGFTTTVTLVGGADTSVVSGNCYQYRYLVSDNVGNLRTYTSVNVAKVDARSYSTVVLANTGLVNYWRLGEAAITTDTFTGTAGTLLSSRSGEIGATWTTYGTPQTTAVLSSENRVRRNGVGNANYLTSGVPPSANYSVQGDVHVKSVLTSDLAGIGARAVAGDNYYAAALISFSGATYWYLFKVVNGVSTTLSATATTVSAGQTYTLKLNVVGSQVTMWANGSQVASVTDTSLASAGNALLPLGFVDATPAPTNTTGFHLDNFRATPMAADSKGTAEGTYWNGPALSQTSAISGDSNTSAQFDGVDDYVPVARQIGDDLSIEFWFKSTQGLGTNAQWWGNAGMVDAEVSGATNDFGVSLRSDGRVVAGTGTPDISITSPSGTAYNNGQWHHVVFTRTKTTGALALYVDGALRVSGTGTANTTLNAPATINLGRIAAGNNYFAGTLDEVATYSTVLSAATVTDHYARR